MTSIDKQPLYKKWWAWIILFIILATIVNSREARMREAALSLVDEEIEPVTTQSIDEETHSIQADEIVTPEFDHEDADIIGACCQTIPFLVVGIDLDPGEYFIQAEHQTHAFLQLAEHQLDGSNNMITTKLIPTHAFMTVNEGEHLRLERGTLIQASEAVVPTFIAGVLGDGMYRVGTDIPPGVYQIEPISDIAGYYQIAADSRGIASNIIENQNFSQETSIILEDGQYLTLLRGKLIQ